MRSVLIFPVNGFGIVATGKGQQFILTGSNARKLRPQGVNLLGGRASQKLMYPYMAAELGKRFKLDTALRQGMLLYRGEDRIKRGGVLCMPCEELLLALRPDSFPD